MYKIAKDQYGTFNSSHHHPLRTVWTKIWGRCYNKNDKAYVNYGERGIKVAEVFKNFKIFVLYLGPKPNEKSTVDRINNDIGYIPGNIKWSSRTVQSINQRMHSNNTSGYIGVTYSKRDKKYVSRITVSKKKIYLGLFSSKLDAAKAYNKAALKHHGKYAKQNIIEENYE